MSVQPGTGYTFTSSGQGTNFSVEFPWQPWSITQGESTYSHPFKVNIVGVVDNVATINVVPGSYNNLDPLCFSTSSFMTGIPQPTTTLSAAGTSYIYLSAGPSADDPPDFPDPAPAAGGYPIVSVETAEQVDSDSFGWVLLAKIVRTVDESDNATYTVNQYVTGSLWGEYFKCGDEPALYWNTRV